MKALISNLSKQSIRNILAVMSVLGIFGLLFLLCFVPIPKGNEAILHILIAEAVGVGFVGVYNYFYGASKNESDRQKSEREKQS